MIPGIVAASGISFSPDDLGTVLSWTKGDDSTFVRAGSQVYSSLNDSGTLGGTWDAETDLHPVATQISNRDVPQYGAGRSFQSNLTAADWDIFSNTTDDVTLSVRFYLHDLPSTSNWIWNNARSLGDRGIAVSGLGDTGVRVQIFDGANVTNLNSNADLLSLGWNTVQITKTSAGVYELFVNDAAGVSTSVSTSAGDAGHPAVVGAREGGSNAWHGPVPEIVIHNKVLSSVELTQMRNYLSREWSATPDYSPLQESVDLAAWWRADKVQIETGVSTWWDESGHNNHQEQSTTADQPLHGLWRNGRPALTNDGTKFIEVASFTQGDLAQPVTHYTAAELNAYVAGNDFFTGFQSSSKRNDFYVSNNNFRMYAGVELTASPSVSGDEFKPFISRRIYDSTTSKYRYAFDGGSEYTGSGDAGTQPCNGIETFSASGGGSNLDGDIAEKLIFEGIAGSDTAASDENDVALRAKYDVEPT